jgi:hypothetical protein
VLAGALSCRKRALESATSPARVASGAAATFDQPIALTNSRASSTLPEDPAAGERSRAQWRAHMAEEERERRLNYDRRKSKDHRAVVSFLKSSRASYDRATTKAAILAAERKLSSEIGGVRERIEKIDRWRVNSNLLEDYRALLELLSGPYPAARSSALSGDSRNLDALRAEFDTRMNTIAQWLARAAEAEDE